MGLASRPLIGLPRRHPEYTDLPENDEASPSTHSLRVERCAFIPDDDRQSPARSRRFIVANSVTLAPALPDLYPEKAISRAFKVSGSALYRWRKAGILKPIRIGTRNFYRAEDIQRLVNEGAPNTDALASFAPPGSARDKRRAA
jgi:hypothetical protein